jgi:hypothetical protein
MTHHLWDPDIRRVIEGQALRFDGGVVNLVSAIQQRWGWPRASARTAAEHLRSFGEPAIWVDAWNRGRVLNGDSSAKRLAQQVEMFHVIPSLQAELCTGLVGRVFQSAEYADHVADCVVVRFANPIEEHGLVRGIVDEVAKRLSMNAGQARTHVEVDRDSEPGLVSVLVKNGGDL